MLPLCLQPIHVLWLLLRPDRDVTQILGGSRELPFRMLGHCGQHIQGTHTMPTQNHIQLSVPAPADVPRGS